MAHLWVRDAEGNLGVFPLLGVPIDLTASPPRRAVDPVSEKGVSAVLAPAPAAPDAPPVWVMMAQPAIDVQVNGLRLSTGLLVLADRDEIRVGGLASMFFSSETLARVEAFPGSERPVYCGRCRQEIAKGAGAVRCPRCGIWYNQSEELPCWTYTETCAFCPQPTSLEAGFQWVPED